MTGLPVSIFCTNIVAQSGSKDASVFYKVMVLIKLKNLVSVNGFKHFPVKVLLNGRTRLGRGALLL